MTGLQMRHPLAVQVACRSRMEGTRCQVKQQKLLLLQRSLRPLPGCFWHIPSAGGACRTDGTLAARPLGDASAACTTAEVVR